MNQAQFYCQSIKRICNNGGQELPAEYQQVEWLASDGSQWIDTGTLISSSLETHCLGRLTHIDNLKSLVGGRNDNANNGRYIPLALSAGHRFRACYDGYDAEVSSVSVSNTDITVIYNDASHKMFANGVQVADFSNKTLAESVPVTLTLFALNGYSGGVNFKSAGRLMSVTLYNNTNGNKLHAFVPCYRKSDNKPGMYDLVTNTFFTNAGTGEFTVGSNI